MSLKCCLLTWRRALENLTLTLKSLKRAHTIFLFYIFKGWVWSKICLVKRYKWRETQQILFFSLISSKTSFSILGAYTFNVFDFFMIVLWWKRKIFATKFFFILRSKTLPRARAQTNLPNFWNWTYKSIPDQQPVFKIEKKLCSVSVYHSTLVLSFWYHRIGYNLFWQQIVLEINTVYHWEDLRWGQLYSFLPLPLYSI